jgi:hypothetical protein
MGYSRQENWKFSSDFAINLGALTASSEAILRHIIERFHSEFAMTDLLPGHLC